VSVALGKYTSDLQMKLQTARDETLSSRSRFVDFRDNFVPFDGLDGSLQGLHKKPTSWLTRIATIEIWEVKTGLLSIVGISGDWGISRGGPDARPLLTSHQRVAGRLHGKKESSASEVQMDIARPFEVRSKHDGTPNGVLEVMRFQAC